MGISRRNETQFIRSSNLEPINRMNVCPEERIQYFTRLIHDVPECGEAYYQRARALYLKGDMEAAQADFKSTLERSPGHKGALLGLSLVASRLSGNAVSRSRRNRCTSVRPVPDRASA